MTGCFNVYLQQYKILHVDNLNLPKLPHIMHIRMHKHLLSASLQSCFQFNATRTETVVIVGDAPASYAGRAQSQLLARIALGRALENVPESQLEGAARRQTHCFERRATLYYQDENRAAVFFCWT